MGFTKILESDKTGKKISELADIPELTADELKQRFDALPNMVADMHNTLADELEENTAAGSIGAVAPEGILASGGTVQEVLNTIAASTVQSAEARHTHENKSILDAITKNVKAAYDRLVTLFAAITKVSDSVENNSTSMPTGKAVVDYVADFGGMAFCGAYSTFPWPGEENKLYIDDTVEPRLIYTWDADKEDYVLTGGTGGSGSGGSNEDISITLTSTGWTGAEAPYQQTVNVPQLREGMAPVHFLDGTTDAEQYAYSLIANYVVESGQITFYAADLPAVDLSLVLKDVSVQEYVDNTVLVQYQEI